MSSTKPIVELEGVTKVYRQGAIEVEALRGLSRAARLQVCIAQAEVGHVVVRVGGRHVLELRDAIVGGGHGGMIEEEGTEGLRDLGT